LKRRAYHFLPARYALDDLRHRRLKIARIDELNDPFELWAVAQPDRRLRRAFRKTKEHIAQHYGLLCFSMSWHNPLLWSHYADRHHGLALGFDLNDLKQVSYVEKRPVPTEINEEVAQWLLFTKYKDWQYEEEARVFTTLKDRDPATRLYFADFGEQLVLREVIVGPLSSVTKQDLHDSLRDATGVTFTKGRLAFNSFRVVEDQRGFRPIIRLVRGS
jgi:hypothetical protein